jgi:hypothetical protein
MMKSLLMPTLTLLAAASFAAPFAPPLAAQDRDSQGGPTPSDATRVTYHGRQRQLDVAVPKRDLDLRIDGRLSEADWNEAALLTGFSQYNPVDRLPAEDSTEVLVMYDDHAIYFGVRAFEPHGSPQARLSDRDKIGGDDNITFILDTFNDKRRAMTFGVNALGVQNDGMLSDGSNIDVSPDFLFESKGHVTDYGYELEVRIPFKSMRYQDVNVQQWGFNVLRAVQHSGQEQTWTPVERATSFLGQSGRFTDMTGLKRGLVLDVNPVMTARSLGSRPTPTADWRYTREDPEFGGNARWGITPNLTLNATFNPDFSQVESDVSQIVTDPRQALSFPEKRPFFLESNEYFQVPNSLIYTRRIGAPEGAAKLNGKIGNLNVGFLSAIDDNGAAADNPIYNILRMRRDIGAQSNIGVVYTDRMQGDNYNRVAAADTRLVFDNNKYIFAGQLGASFTRIGASPALNAKPLFDVSMNRTGREFGWSARLNGTHPEFITQSGFTSRTGIAHANIQPRWTWYPKESFIRTISFAPHADATWEWDRFTKGTFPNDMKMNSSTNAVFTSGWRASIYHWSETFKYPDYLYTNFYIARQNATTGATDTVPYTGVDRLTNLGIMTTVNTPQWRQFSASAEILGGQDDNFDEWSSAWILYSTIALNWQPTERVRVNGRYVEQRVHRKSDGSLVSVTMVPRLKMEYQINRPMFFRFVGQYSSQKKDALRDDSRTEAPILIRNRNGTFSQSVAQEGGSFRADWLFSYQPNPGTVLFIGYGSSLAGENYFEPSGLERLNDGFFVKLSYLWRAR